MIGVLSRNREFRKLWLAQLVSGTGDWLNRVALLGLIARFGSGNGVSAAAAGLGALYAGELVARFLPDAFVGPFSGPVADRFSRKALMVMGDLANAVLALGYLLIRSEAAAAWIYPLIVAQMVVSMFFHSARQAAVTSVVPKHELHDALAITSLTWSLVLSVGAVLGGALTSRFGSDAVFVIDSVTYLASAVLIARTVLPAMPVHPDAFSWRHVLLFTDLRRAFEHVRERRLLPALATKVLWGGCGGYMTMLSIVGVVRFAGSDKGATAVGMLFGARGLGTGLGPVLARRLFGSSEDALRKQISASFVVAAVGYAFFAEARSLPLACALISFAHLGGSTLWTASSVWLQRSVDDAFRGRAFALDFFGMTIAFSAGAVLAGRLFDSTHSIPITVWATSVLVLACGGLWTWIARPRPEIVDAAVPVGLPDTFRAFPPVSALESGSAGSRDLEA